MSNSKQNVSKTTLLDDVGLGMKEKMVNLNLTKSNDVIIQKFTRRMDYKSVNEHNRETFCSNISDQMKIGLTSVLDELKAKHQLDQQHAQQQRQQWLSQVKKFRAQMEKLLKEDIPKILNGMNK